MLRWRIYVIQYIFIICDLKHTPRNEVLVVDMPLGVLNIEPKLPHAQA
jgi:hypothetical protein